MPRASAARRQLVGHRAPEWFEDAKLGIFLHWGVYSVPAWAPRSDGTVVDLLRTRSRDFGLLLPYSEWYANALRLPGSPTRRHHAEHHGSRPYDDFRAPFEAALERWDPGDWAATLVQTGARYVVLTTKHHDGYTLWPSAVPNPRKPGWHTARDVVGELAGAVRERGLRFGAYYSGGLDWTWNARPIRTFADIAACVPDDPAYATYVDAHFRELVERYRPDVLWNDIAVPRRLDVFRLLVDYLTIVPNGTVNDRFAYAPPGAHLLSTRAGQAATSVLLRLMLRRAGGVPIPRAPWTDFRTPEYSTFPAPRREKWEATRGIGHSFGYNRAETDADLLTSDALVRLFVDIVSKNGNLLLNIGVSGDARLMSAQAERVLALGRWLGVNGEAIYGSRPWIRAEGATDDPGVEVRFTTRDATVYAIVLGRPTRSWLRIADVPHAERRVELLGRGPVRSWTNGRGLEVEWPRGLDAAPAFALRIGDPPRGHEGSPPVGDKAIGN